MFSPGKLNQDEKVWRASLAALTKDLEQPSQQRNRTRDTECGSQWEWQAVPSTLTSCQSSGQQQKSNSLGSHGLAYRNLEQSVQSRKETQESGTRATQGLWAQPCPRAAWIVLQAGTKRQGSEGRRAWQSTRVGTLSSSEWGCWPGSFGHRGSLPGPM